MFAELASQGAAVAVPEPIRVIDGQRTVSGVYGLPSAAQRAADAVATAPARGLGVEALEVGSGEDRAGGGGHS